MKSIDTIIYEEIKRALNEDASYLIMSEIKNDYYNAYNALTKLEESTYKANRSLSQSVVKLQLKLREMFSELNGFNVH